MGRKWEWGILRGLGIWFLWLVISYNVSFGITQHDRIIVALVTDLHENKANLVSIEKGIGKLFRENPELSKLILAFNGDWTTRFEKKKADDAFEKTRSIDDEYNSRLAFSKYFSNWISSLHNNNPALGIVLAPGNHECGHSNFVDAFFRNVEKKVSGSNRIYPVSTISNWEINGSTRYKRFGNVVIVPYCTDYHYKWAHGGDTDAVVRAINNGIQEVEERETRKPIVVILSHAGMPESENVLLKAVKKSIGNIPTFLVIGHDHKAHRHNGERIQQSGDTAVDVTVVAPKAYGNSMPCIKIDADNPEGILIPSPFDNSN